MDHRELPSPYTAAGASLVTFAVGALIPLLPYLFGYDNLALALGLAAVAAFVGGGLVARLTDRPFLRGALRQLMLGAAAAGITFAIGSAVGAGVAMTAQPASGRAYQESGRTRRPRGRPGGGQQLEVRLHHHRDQLVEADLGLPAELLARPWPGRRTAGPPRPAGRTPRPP